MTVEDTPEPEYAYLAINSGGGETKGFATEAQARAWAEALRYIVVKAPIVADYRSSR